MGTFGCQCEISRAHPACRCVAPTPFADAEHPVTPAGDRVPSSVVLRLPAEYAARGGVLATAADGESPAPGALAPLRARIPTAGSKCKGSLLENEPDPVVVTFPGIVSSGEAASIIETARAGMKAAGVTPNKKQMLSTAKTGRVLAGGVPSTGRTNTNAWLAHDASPAVRAVVDRVADIAGLPAATAESLQVIHYAVGQEYQTHWDAWDPRGARGSARMSRRGNRVLTALIYLTNVEAGGGTGFANLNFQVQPEEGKLLLFHNCYPGSRTPHPDSAHAGLPVTRGEKWACNLWYVFRSADATLSNCETNCTTARGDTEPLRTNECES
jgi:prolyl 4-hydroxylase